MQHLQKTGGGVSPALCVGVFARVASKGLTGYGTWKSVRRMEDGSATETRSIFSQFGIRPLRRSSHFFACAPFCFPFDFQLATVNRPFPHTRSATVVSMRLKKNSPPSTTSATAKAEAS